MGERKKIRRQLGQRLAPLLGGLLMKWLHRTCRWTYVGREPVDRLLAEGRSFVCPTWHFDHISVLYHFRACRGVVMVSPSRDGDIIAGLVRRWGYAVVRGSRHKGGMDAAREMVVQVKNEKRPAGLIADGSQGPARRAQKGSVFIARAAGVPMIPAIIVARWKITLPPGTGCRFRSRSAAWSCISGFPWKSRPRPQERPGTLPHRTGKSPQPSVRPG